MEDVTPQLYMAKLTSTSVAVQQKQTTLKRDNIEIDGTVFGGGEGERIR